MKLAAVYFDDTVVIPGGKDLGSGQKRQDLRESTFHASEGWDLERVEPGVYRLRCEGMAEPAYVEGYGSTFVKAPDIDRGDILDSEAAAQAPVRAKRLRKP